MTRSLGGNVTPPGSQRRRLAPLTGSAVWGAGDPAPLAPPQQGRLVSARVWRTHTVSASPGFQRTDFHLPGSQTFAAPPPRRIPARPRAREPEVGDERRPPLPPRAEAAAQVEAAACAALRAGGLGLSPLSLAAWAGAGRVPAAHLRVPGLRAGRASQTQG